MIKKLALKFFPLFAFALLVVSTQPILAQTWDVVGLVQDGDKGEPIGQVEITLKSGKILGYTNTNGRFEVKVNNRGTVLIFNRHTYKMQELDISTLTELIDIEVSMQSDIIELAEKDTVARGPARQFDQAKTMEELELMQGMKIDLNDHLRQLPGVSGMNEFTNDISVWGSRTNDVTHYLGLTRIPSLRHLDIGFPGNQSVLNPRLLKSITVADNLAKGPINQGNSSALVYDLKEGDPNNITGDMVFGTVNRELNMTGYWGGRTFTMSGRYLDPAFLKNLGLKFFTDPKDARLNNNGKPCDNTNQTVPCDELKDPFKFTTADGYIGTFYHDSTGAFARHSFIGLDDTYLVQQDVSKSLIKSDGHTIVKGTQDGVMYAYESLTPYTTGDLQFSLGMMHRNRQETFKDTLPPVEYLKGRPWYFSENGTTVENLIGDGQTEDYQFNNSYQWNANEKMWGASYGYGVDLEYLKEVREFKDISPGLHTKLVPQDYALVNGLFRLKWNLENKQTLEAAAGASLVYQDLFKGTEAGLITPAPIVSLRYGKPILKSMTGFGEIAIRENTALAPTDTNKIKVFTTSSAEGKVGVEGGWKEDVKYTACVYSRLYKDPQLPAPEVFWNYQETHSSDYAYVSGSNITVTWLPSHHFGMNMNGSVVQGDYHLDNDNFLPWEANRTLDVVTNFRVLPRKDSLLSFIVTYGVNNGVPLYEYTGLTSGNNFDISRRRTVGQFTDIPTVSRQRTDMRINLDLKSHWRPLDGMRFFFEADNIFANANSPFFKLLGGDNERRRGWTRANTRGDLEPVVVKGMGLFIMFGFEGKILL